MTLFWKLYLSIILLVMSCFSIGSYGIIQSHFDSSLQQEIQQAYQENDVISSLLDDNYSAILKFQNSKKEFYLFFQQVMIQNFNRSISFCIRNQKGEILYLNDHFKDNKSFQNTDMSLQFYQIEKHQNHYSLYTTKSYSHGLYIENKRDVTFLFQNRLSQYEIFFSTSLFLLIGIMIIIYFITRWLISPIQKLSQTTQKITQSQQFEYLDVKGHDEITQLTQNFNTMLKRLEQSIQQIKEVNQKQNLFINHFNHELKTPLTTIIGFAETICSKKINEEETIVYAHYILQEGKRLESLSKKLMDLMILKKKDYLLQKIFVPTLISYIEKTIKPILKKANIHYHIDVLDGYIFADPDLMITVLLNLIDNAKKAIQRPDGFLFIRGFYQTDGYVIQIQDNGCGMDPSEFSKIKEPFYMIDKSRSHSYQSSGLGLSIVDTIVHIHHAELKIESQINSGTTMSLIFKETNHEEL